MKTLKLVAVLLLIGFFSIQKSSAQLKIDTLFNGINEVEVTGSFCDVSISGSDAENVSVKGELKIEAHGMKNFNKNDYSIKCEKKGDKLMVEIKQPSNIKMVGSMRMDGHITLVVPKKINVSISNSSGNIHASTLSGKFCKLHTSSGDQKITDINSQLSVISSSGNISVNEIKGAFSSISSSGDQALKNIFVDSTFVKASSGNIRCENMVAKLRMSTSSGDIYLSTLAGEAFISSTSGNQIIDKITGNLRTVATSGDVQISNQNGDVKGNSTSGNIRLNKSIGALWLATTSGDIIGKEVDLNKSSDFITTSGQIECDVTNNYNDLGFKLNTSSGQLKVNIDGHELNGERKLELNQGKITIKGITTSGDQHFM